MKIIGLTGGIASGKSTVAALLASMEVPVIDADKLSREAVKPGQPAHREIASLWPEVIRPDQTIDRARLGAIVFAEAGPRHKLTCIVLPQVERLYRSLVEELKANQAAFCIFEAATLFEEGIDNWVDGILLVSLSPEKQIERLARRNGYSEDEARARLAAQFPLEEKQRRSRWVIENHGSLNDLEKKVRDMWERIRREA